MSNTCGTIDCLTADEDGTWVEDEHGGVWWPSDEALAEIEASGNPQATALRICHESPMRGQWKF